MDWKARRRRALQTTSRGNKEQCSKYLCKACGGMGYSAYNIWPSYEQEINGKMTNLSQSTNLQLSMALIELCCHAGCDQFRTYKGVWSADVISALNEPRQGAGGILIIKLWSLKLSNWSSSFQGSKGVNRFPITHSLWEFQQIKAEFWLGLVVAVIQIM